MQGQVLFWQDPSAAHMPLLKLAQEAVAEGRLPLWTDALGGGFPLMAEGQAAALYPARALLYLGLPYHHAYSWTVYLHLVLGALGCGLLGRRLGLGTLGAIYAALAFGFSGCFLSRVPTLSALQSAAWLPWLLLCLTAGVHTGRWPWFLGAAATLALSMYGGHLHYVFLLLLAAVVTLLWLLGGAQEAPGGRRVARVLGGGLLAVLLGLGLAAAQWMPTATLIAYHRSQAVDAPAPLLEVQTPPPARAYYALAHLLDLPAGNETGRDRPGTVGAVLAGGLTALLAVVALFSRRLPLRHKWLWALIAVLGVFMAQAYVNPLCDYLPHGPGFSLLCSSARYQIFAALGMALLAGGAIQSLAGERRRAAGARLAAWSAAGLAAAGLLTAAAQPDLRPTTVTALTQLLTPLYRWRVPGSEADLLARVQAHWEVLSPHLSLHNPPWLACGAGLAIALLASVLLWRTRLPYRIAAAALLAALGGQLYLFGQQAHPTAPATFYTSPPRVVELDQGRADWGRVYSDPSLYSRESPAPQQGGGAGGDLTPHFARRESLPGNLAPLWGMESAHSVYALAPAGHRELYEHRLPAGLAGDASAVAAPVQVLRMAGVRTLIAGPGLHSPWLRVLRQEEQHWVYAVAAPMPRGWLPARVESAPDLERALERLRAPDLRPEQWAVVEGLDPALAARLRGGWGTVRTTEQEPLRRRWQVRTPTAAFLVLSMTYYPLWQATVNGEPARLYRVNAVQCGLPVPAGDSVVELAYDPWDLRLGLYVSAGSGAAGLLALMVMLVILLAQWIAARRRRRSTSPPPLAEQPPPQEAG